MKTPKEYLDKGYPIIPCRGKVPTAKAWQNTDFTVEDFKPGDNIGFKWNGYFDVDVDNIIAKKYLSTYLEPCSAIWGRKSNPRSHFAWKGKPIHKKFALTKHFASYIKDFSHGACLIECRSGSDKQSIVPGSVIKGENVEWEVFEGISPYGGNPYDDIAKVALSTALEIIAPPDGNRTSFLFTIACILARLSWTDDEVNKFVYKICTNAFGKAEPQSELGTAARNRIKNKGRLMGFPKLKEITGIEFQGLFEIFSWVGLEKPNEKLLELIDRYYYIEDVGMMYDPQTASLIRDKEFNNKWLYDFTGGKGKDKAWGSLLKAPEFQEKKCISRQFLPKEDFPLAEVSRHELLKPGKYYNIFNGFDYEPVKPGIKKVTGADDVEREVDAAEEIKFLFKHFEDVLGKDNWNHVSQYIAMCVKNPGLKLRWMPLIVSVEGVGKGLLLRMIANMMSQEYVNENVSFADITEKHSTIVVGTLFAALNEVSIDGGQYTTKRTISAKIKPFITDDFVNINEKGKPIYKYLNCCNGMIFSNDKDCLHIDTSSRRYLVIHVKTTAKQVEEIADKGTFARLWEIVSEHAEELLYTFINDIQIEDESVYQKRAPKTPDLLTMIEDSKHDLEDDLTTAFEQKLAPFDDTYFRGFISLHQLTYFIRTQWKIQHPNKKILKNWLKEKSHKWDNGEITRQIVMKSSKPRVHWLDNTGHRSKLNTLTEGELGQLADAPYPGEYMEAQYLDYGMSKITEIREQHESLLLTNSFVPVVDYQRWCHAMINMDPKALKMILKIQEKFCKNGMPGYTLPSLDRKKVNEEISKGLVELREQTKKHLNL